MSTQPKAGEMLVGGYLKAVEECEIVAYGQHSPIAGEQMEVDVVGLHPEDDQAVVACEVATHIRRGLGYGTAAENRDRVASKFRNVESYVNRAFPTAESYRFEFWSPKVGGKSATKLADVATEFEARTGHELELVINGSYTERIGEMREAAGATAAQGNELGFRFLQILEHLQAPDT
jgi:hypothetical protein